MKANKSPGNPQNKPRNFNGTVKKILKYAFRFKKIIICAIIAVIISTIFTVMSPYVLGTATSEIYKGMTSKANYADMQNVLENLSDEDKVKLNEKSTIQDAINLNLIPEVVKEKIPAEDLNSKIYEERGINFKKIANILITVFIIYALNSGSRYIANRLMSLLAQRAEYQIRKDIDKKLTNVPLEFYDKQTHGEILSRVTNDVEAFSLILRDGLIEVVSVITTLIGILYMMLKISISMTAAAILILPASYILIKFLIGASQKYFVKFREELGNLNSHIEEIYEGDTVVKAFSMEERELENFRQINNRVYKTSWISNFLSKMMAPLIMFLTNVGYIAICIIGAKEVIKGRIKIGEIQAFIQYTRQFMMPISQVAEISNILQNSVASAERIFEILEAKEEDKDPKDVKKIGISKGKIEFEDVSFSYKKDEKLIENFSLYANPGQTVAIVGPTGAGKTTILNLLMRFYDIDSGKILIDGIDIMNVSKDELRKQFTMVLQDTWLFNGTIRENLEYGSTNVTEEDVKQAAKMAQVDHFINSLPGGYDFKIDEEASNISAGQKQLLTIARAILANSPILILDEATSNVDTRTERIIQEAMNKLMKGRTSFVIAHRLSTIKNADVIIVLEKGNIVEKGTHESLIIKNGPYAKLYNSQFETAN